jgi:pentatricopeptide repeat protein
LLEEDVVNFDVIFNQALDNGILATGSTADAIARGAMILAEARPELLVRWNQYVQLQLHPPVTSVLSAPISPVDQLSPSAEANTIGDDTYDTYWEKTDSDTSNAIDTLLDRSKYNKIADLRRMYRNTRRSGMVLRLTTLAKIVTAASRTAAHQDFIEEIYRNAEVDTPLVHGSHVSKFGWACFMDSLIAAYLNLGNREKANIHHEQMLQMGASPSANTFGLYIVSLRSTHQTHDEASEAVEIFDRARAEDVLPTSFLYNALIGKLSKARRVDDCLFYFAQMRALGIKPTSVTYGTMINALARVGDEGFAEELFQEMESMANYKPRPAPYNSLMQFFITNKRDRSKVLFYYNRMISMKIVPTSHTYKLLIEAYATLDKPDMKAAEGVLATMNANKCTIESSHHAALIHAKGCVLQDVSAAIAHFRDIFNTHRIQPDATLYQALLECLVAHHRVHETPEWVKDMTDRRIAMTPYIANTLIHGWTQAGNIERAREIYDGLVGFGSCGIGQARREPSTYEAMVRGYLAVEDRQNATLVAGEMIARGYPAAVVARVTELVRGATDGATISGGVGVGGNAVAGDGSYLPGGTQEFVTQELS